MDNTSVAIDSGLAKASRPPGAARRPRARARAWAPAPKMGRKCGGEEARGHGEGLGPAAGPGGRGRPWRESGEELTPSRRLRSKRMREAAAAAGQLAGGKER